MAFTGRFRFLYQFTKTVPLIASGFGFTVSATEHFERTQQPWIPRLQIHDFELSEATVKRFEFAGGSPVPILHISSHNVKIDTAALNSVLDKVGNRPFAIYSVNGPARTGKSFLLNYFIRYLESSTDNHESDKKRSQWMKRSIPKQFVWKGETDRCTKGINIWSEPFEMVTKEGRKIPVLLMDCQGAFDDQTSIDQNAIIFAISTLLSSVVIFNIMRQVEENIMQFLEVFAEYAIAVSVVDSRAKAGSANFQKLLILVRDFDFPNYKLGYHSNTSTPFDSGKNYKMDKIDPQPHQPKEIQDSRMSILGAFEDVGVYLMPEPGRPLRREDRADQLEQDFRFHLQTLVESTLDPENITTKKVNGVEVTATEFKDFVAAWAKVNWGRELPPIQTIRNATEEAHYQLAKKEALELYNIVMKPLREFEYQLEEKDLLARHERATSESMQLFTAKRKIGGSTHDERFQEEFRADAEKLWEDIKTLNKTKPQDTYWARIISYAMLTITAVGGVVLKIWSGSLS